MADLMEFELGESTDVMKVDMSEWLVLMWVVQKELL
jgi:hypothetical protein